MQIVHIIPAYIPAWRYGGPIISVHSLCQSLVSMGHEVTVLTTNLNGPVDCEVPIDSEVVIDGVRVRYFSVPWWGRRLSYAPKLKEYLDCEMKNFDIVHIHTVFAWTSWSGAKTARTQRIPYLISPRGMLIDEMVHKKNRLLKTAWIYLADRQNFERASAIHFTTDLEEQSARHLSLNLPRGFIVPNGIDLNITAAAEVKSEKESSRFKNGMAQILFLSRINWKKGLDRLIPAMRHIPNAQLTIAGNDDENYTKVLKDIASVHHIASKINFIGPVYGNEKIKLLKSADVFVLPSYSENFGNAVLEAMALGCPVVVTPEVGLSGAIKSHNAGIVTEGAPEMLGKAIADLIADKELRNTLSKNASKLALTDFHPQRVAQLMEEQYMKILTHDHSRH